MSTRLHAALSALTSQLQSRTLRVGFLSGATYPDGKSVAQVAAYNEYGSPKRNRPPRPFFRQAIQAGQPTWGKKLAGALRATGYDVDKALGMLGEDIAGEVRESITKFTSPALAPATIARKGFAKPLVDTGMMLRSVSYEVADGN